MILVALAGLAYLAQGYISMIGIPEEQKNNEINADCFTINDCFHVL